MHLDSFDVVSVSIILFVGGKGLFNGTLKELAGLIGLIGGILLGQAYAGKVGKSISNLTNSLDSPTAQKLVGFLLVVGGVWIAFVVIGALLEKKIGHKITGLGDMVTGFLIASAKIFIIFSIIFYSLSTLEFVKKNASRYIQNSKLYPLFLKTGEVFISLPETATDEPPSGAIKIETEPK